MQMDFASEITALKQMVRRLSHKIANGGATGKLVLTNDGGTAQTVQVKLPLGELIDTVPNSQQFGMVSNMPPGGDVVVKFLEGNRSKAVIVGTGHQQHRPRNLVVGGTMLHDSGAETIILNPNGTITINSAHTVVIKGDTKVRIEAPYLEVTGEIIAKCDGDSIHLSTHKHDGVQVGGGNTRKPIIGT